MAKTTREELDEIRSMLQGGDSVMGKLRSGLSEVSAKVEQILGKLSGKSTARDIANQFTNSDTIRGTAVFAHSEGADPNVDATGVGMSGYPVTFGTVDMHLFVTNDGVLTFGADTSGNVRSGSNASVPATTAWAVFSIDQTYNSESMGAGDMLLGDNSTSKANILWDASTGQLKFRTGTTTKAYIDTDGTLVSTDAEIGGWTIDATTIQKLTASVGIILDSANRVIKVGDTSGVHIQIDGGNQRLRSSNFVTGQSGFNISAATGDAEFNNVTARGNFKTAVFEKDTISVVGGNMLILPGDSLASDMTALDSSTLTVLGETTFAVGDILRMKDGTNDEWLEVTSIASAPTYAVTRDKAAAYASNSNPVWKKGQAVANYMQSGDGGVKIESGATPKISCFTHAGSPWTTITEQSYLSELGVRAGAGAVTLDVNGLTFDADGFARLLFNSGATTVADVLANYSSTQKSAQISTRNSTVDDTAITSILSDSGAQVTQATVYSKKGDTIGSKFYILLDLIQYLLVSKSGISINDSGADVDTIIKGDTATIATFDAGLNALGVGGAAESGSALKVTGQMHVTGATYLDGAVIVNENSGSSNFRVESDGNANALLVDGANNRVGILNASPATALDVTGTVTATGLTVGGATLTVIDEGTYTPSLTNVTNVAASTAQTCFYLRVGSKVTVWGGAAIDPTAAGNTVFGVSLPVASNLALARNLVGHVARAGASDEIGTIEGDTTNDRANVTYTAAVTTNHNVIFNFSYTII